MSFFHREAPLPPDPLPHQGKGEAVLMKRKRDNQRFKLNRTPLPSLFGEGSGVGWKSEEELPNYLP